MSRFKQYMSIIQESKGIDETIEEHLTKFLNIKLGEKDYELFQITSSTSGKLGKNHLIEVINTIKKMSGEKIKKEGEKNGLFLHFTAEAIDGILENWMSKQKLETFLTTQKQ